MTTPTLEDRHPCGNSRTAYPPGSREVCEICNPIGAQHPASTAQCPDCGHCHVCHGKA